MPSRRMGCVMVRKRRKEGDFYRTCELHQPSPGFGEVAAFAATEGDVCDEGLTFHAVASVDETIAAAIDVGMIDLIGIANHDEFGAFGHAGDDGFGFLGGELLGFVEDEKAVRDGASADVGEGFDFDDSLIDESVVGFLVRGFVFALVAFAFWTLGGLGVHEEIEGVVDRLQPGAHFFLEGAGQVSELFTHRDDGAADGEAIVVAGKHSVEAGGHGDEGFAGAGLSEAGDEGDFGVEEGIDEAHLPEVEGLEVVTIGDANDFGNGEADEGVGGGETGGDRLFFASFEKEVLVEMEVGEAVVGEFDFAGAGEALHFILIQNEARHL